MHFEESKHPRDKKGRFSDKESDYPSEINGRIRWAKDNGIELPLNSDGSVDDLRLQKLYEEGESKREMTPAEKIASVHIDFDRDNILPKLNGDTLMKLGVKENKNVLLKGQTIKRNLGKHLNVSEKTMESIITEALYNPIDVFPANPENLNYFHLAAFVEVEDKRGLKMGLVLLDTDVSKAEFEVGHAYYVDSDGFKRALNKTNKKTDTGSRAAPSITSDSKRGT